MACVTPTFLCELGPRREGQVLRGSPGGSWDSACSQHWLVHDTLQAHSGTCHPMSL